MADEIEIAIIYSTGEGQTSKISNYLGEWLESAGHSVELFDVEELGRKFSLDDYDAVIVGASIHAGHFARRIRKFIKRNLGSFKELPSGFFSVSLSAADDTEEAIDRVREYFDQLVGETGWRPAVYAAFAGAMPFSSYGFLMRRIMKVVGREVEDVEEVDTSRDYEYTDWASVEEFGRQFLEAIAILRGEDLGKYVSRKPRPRP